MNSRSIKHAAHIGLAVAAVAFGLRVFLWGGEQFQDPNDSPLYESTLRRALQNFKTSEVVLGRDKIAPSGRYGRTAARSHEAYAGRQAGHAHGSRTGTSGVAGALPTGKAGEFIKSGLSKYQKQDYAGALQDFSAASKFAPDNHYPWLYLYMTYAKLGETQEARDAYAKARQLQGKQPGRPAPQQTTPQAESKPAAQQPEAIDPKSIDAKPEDFIAAGRKLYREANYKEAMDYFDTAIKLDPTNPEPYYSMANCCYATGDLDRMVQYYEAAAKVVPNDSTAHYYLGIAYTEAGQLEKALAAYEKAIELDPNNTQAREGLGRVLKQQGKLEEAMRQFQYEIDRCSKIISENPNDPLAYNNLAKVYLRNGLELDKAAELIRKALALAPDNATCLATDAQLAAAAGDYARALRSIDKAIEQNTANVKYYKLLRKRFATKAGEAAPVAGE